MATLARARGVQEVMDTRWSTESDSEALARIHADAWRFAYAGLIPGIAFERMIAARGPRWWRALHETGEQALLVELDGAPVGYARFGRCRSHAFKQAGEVYELYLDPACHGAGLGRRLFEDARSRLRSRALDGVLVWSLAVNDIGCRFYRALGGRILARGRINVGGAEFERIAFAWP